MDVTTLSTELVLCLIEAQQMMHIASLRETSLGALRRGCPRIASCSSMMLSSVPTEAEAAAT
jgi:hypothetical protein